MSHITGTVQTVAPAIRIGPDTGAPATGPGVWALDFAHTPAPTGTKLVILHFNAVNLPVGNRLEVDLGYGTDVFTSADGGTFWTRPVNIHKLAGALVPIRYVAAATTAGGVTLDQYGRGERHAGQPGHNSVSNCDPFLPDPTYTEPQYDDFWFCAPPPNWENVACVTAPGDVRTRVARSVGMIMSVEGPDVSTCSVTLVDTDKVLTAGHCHTPDQALGSSVTFDYRVECNGARPAGYDAKFIKVVEVLSHHNDGVGDFSLLRLAEAPMGIPVVQMRPDIPGVGESVFGVHHPNGAPKKLSVPHPGFSSVTGSGATSINVPSDFHVSGGSSGSGLFDTAGRIVGVLSTGNPCGRGTGGAFPLIYFPTATILKAIAPAPPPPVTRDVMVVFDRSGSMTEPDAAGRAKIDAARDAASLFVQLVKSSVGNRVGLTSFSTGATNPTDFAIQSVDPAHKLTLLGAPPFAGGLIGGLVPGGATSIGDGLERARQQFPAPGANPRAILLLTDGMQNTPPWVGDVAGSLAGIDVHAIGFGTDANIDGALLASLAGSHNGQFTRAESGLALEKFFSHAFGNIFEAGIISDPEYVLPADVSTGTPQAFPVCGEDAVTVVIGWDDPGGQLAVAVTTPAGVTVTAATPGVEADTGRTWTFLRVPLPHDGERSGTWTVTPFRPGSGGELAPPAPALRYFVNVIAGGGPRLERHRPEWRVYTGDTFNPAVRLRQDDGGWPDDVAIDLTLTRPTASLGTLLSRERLGAPTDASGDTIPARQSTAMALAGRTAGPLIPTSTQTLALSDGPESTFGAFEASALMGRELTDLTVDGHYQLHFQATYGGGCGRRELLATLFVDVGIDPGHSAVTVADGGPQPGGAHTGTVTIVPQDRFGNMLGPGRPDAATVTGAGGTTVTGPVVDNGDGSYTVPVAWSPAGGPPGVVVGQPGRPPVTITPPSGGGASGGRCRRCWLLVAVLVVLALVLLIVLAAP
ncbi:MAG: vWA domain-containing protein [Thermoleophilia bacterium]